MKQFLFLDAANLSKEKKIFIGEKKLRGIKVSHYKVLEKDKKKINRDAGDYFELCFSEKIAQNSNILKRELGKVVDEFLKKYHKVNPILVIGLGNSEILADSFGSMVTNKMIATNQYNDFLTIPKVALFNPEVTSKTVISSLHLIELVLKNLNPYLFIIIDSLATKNAKYLNRVIEISDTGIIPGSYLRANKEINKNTFHIPIISIGIPFLYQSEEGLFTNVFLKSEIEELSNLVADCLNKTILF